MKKCALKHLVWLVVTFAYWGVLAHLGNLLEKTSTDLPVRYLA